MRARRLKVIEALPVGTFCIALLLCVYQEMAKANFILIAPLLLLAVIFDRLQFRRLFAFTFGSHLLGALTVFPQTAMVLDAALYQLRGFKSSGWPQPQWASPLEILGFLDLYRNNPANGYQYLGRDEIEFAVVEGCCGQKPVL